MLIFYHFFYNLLLSEKVSKHTPKGSKIPPKCSQKPSKNESWQQSGKTLKKSGKTLAPSCPSGRSHMQSTCAGAVKTQFSILSPGPKKQKKTSQTASQKHQKTIGNPPKIDPRTYQKPGARKQRRKSITHTKKTQKGSQAGTQPGGELLQ